MSAFPEAPPNLKAIQPYLKIASEHDARDFVGELDGWRWKTCEKLIVN